ncbi:MAG: hypothetical protein KAI24_01550 [Planctomycetes bacterium]|nr:hypothetical protein [Planctomycetota bacterium]
MFAKLPLLFLTTALAAQASPAPQDPARQDAAPTVAVPTYPNSTCPIMGRKASLPLFADTELGRIYVCCKPCIRKILADVRTAYETAYPVTKDLANRVCPVSGEPIGKQAVSVVLQGLRIQICCEGCRDEARRHAQVTLAKAHDPKLEDLQNQRCPVDGKPVQPNAFAVIGATVVRLSSPSHLAEVQKQPQALLDKARADRKPDPAKPVHEHRPGSQPGKPAGDAPGAPSTGKEGK